MIKPIDTWSVEQITSGQVVTSLSSAVKELVENALDAGATVVEVKLVNHGKDGFSVSDNGHGIDPEDFEFIAQKHATSKLRGFEDLSNVQTLGFRGEALASLCALADVTVTTNSDSASSGHELEFDHTGRISKQRRLAAPRGTVISVNNLFDQLPVRRKTFERGSAREFAKTVELIQEYALLNPVRLTLEHIMKNRSNSMLRSQGAKLIQRIACVYGAKRTKTLQQIEPGQTGSAWKFSGYVSKPEFGMGDTASTCQLLAVNGRPTSQPRLLRAVVELYKQYNFTEQPFFIIDIDTSPENFDINVTPDKRTLLFHDEDQLINEMKKTLEASFGESGHSVPRMSQIEPPQPKKPRQSLVSFAAFSGGGSVIDQETVTSTESLREESNEEPRTHIRNYTEEDDAESQIGQSENSLRSSNELSDAASDAASDVSASDEPATEGDEQLRTETSTASFTQQSREIPNTSRTLSSPKTSDRIPNFSELRSSSYSGNLVLEEDLEDRESLTNGQSMQLESQENRIPMLSHTHHEKSLSPSTNSECSDLQNDLRDRYEEEDRDQQEAEQDVGPEEGHEVHIKEEPVDEEGVPDQHDSTVERSSVQPPSQLQSAQEEQQIASRASAHLRTTLNTHIHLPLTLQDIDAAVQESSKSHEKTMKRLQTLAIDEEGAEERLQLSIRKEDFDHMDVVGQFNLGFILVVNRKSSHDDLFVIDQHASDEIYNFERLQSSTILSRQPLVVPQTLELSAAEELTIQDNMSVFENNGFTILVNSENPPGSQCVLTSVPYSKSTIFNERDVFELLSKLKEDSNQPKLRCSKLRSMFAMRACRSSIMIGTPLKASTMEMVVRHMGTLNKPWNCPHGRPTLRHITTLS